EVRPSAARPNDVDLPREAAIIKRRMMPSDQPGTAGSTDTSRCRQSRGFADTELKRRMPGKWSTRRVAEALDEQKAAKRDEQRQLLRKDAPGFERRDDEIRLGVSREIPRLAHNLRGHIIDPRNIDAHG